VQDGPVDALVVEAALRAIGRQYAPRDVGTAVVADGGVVSGHLAGFGDPVAVGGVAGGSLGVLDLAEQFPVGRVVAGSIPRQARPGRS
jgi:hypothetical protein